MSTTTKHRRIGRALAAAGALLAATAGGIVTAPTASAATCNSGSACLYWRNSNGVSTLIYQNAGNATLNFQTPSTGGWVWNHGVRYPGADHITLTTKFGGYRWRICLHYGAVNYTIGQNTATGLQPGEVVTGWRWRGECAANEDSWHVY
jgi:hypothetical protein